MDNSFEGPANIGCSDDRPYRLTSCYPLPYGYKIIVELKVPDDPYYTYTDGDDRDDYDREPMHSGKMYCLTLHDHKDLDPYAYWCPVEIDADKKTRCIGAGPTTPQDSVQDIMDWIERHFENLSHYWDGYQCVDIINEVALRVALLARKHDPVL